jgi:hypothetical protein
MRWPPMVERVTCETSALVRVCTPADFPGGIVVVPERIGGRVYGLSIGSGVGLAELYGRRDARHAVLVDVERILSASPAPTANHRALVEVTALHEVAHALFGQDYGADVTDTAVVAAAAHVETHDTTTVTDQHHARWAAAFMLLAQRAARLRVHGAAILQLVRQSVTHYGYPAADLERVCHGVDHGASLAALLTPDGAAAALLEAVLPDADTRKAAVVAAGLVANVTGRA